MTLPGRKRLATSRLSPLFLAAALTACGGAGMASYTPVEQKTKFRDDQLFSAADRAVDELRYQTANRDPEDFSLETREKEVGYSNVPRLSYKYTYKISTKNGTLSISTTCVENSAMERTEFKDCGSDRPQRVIDEQDALQKKILTIAARLP